MGLSGSTSRTVKDQVKYQFFIWHQPHIWRTIPSLAVWVQDREPWQDLAGVQMFISQGLARKVPTFQSRLRSCGPGDHELMKRFDPHSPEYSFVYEYRVTTAFRRSREGHQNFHNYYLSRYTRKTKTGSSFAFAAESNLHDETSPGWLFVASRH